MGAVHGLTNVIALLERTTVTATGAQTGVDCTAVQGQAIVFINGSACGSGATQDWKIQHCATQGGSYEDTGYAFTQAGNAAWREAITVNFDGLKKFVCITCTEGGTSSSEVSCHILYRKNMI